MALKLTILSFNVLAQSFIDDRLRREAHDARHIYRGYRVNRQIEILNDVKPDIVLLQEATPIVVRKYKERLTDYHVPSCFARQSWGTPEQAAKYPINGNAVIWRKGLFAGKARCSVIELDRKRGNYAAVVSGTLAATGEHIRVISVHFEWNDIEAASRQFRAIFERGYVRNHKRVIIGGDFNMGGSTPETFPILRDIAAHGFTDHAPDDRTHPFPDEAKTITHVLTRGLTRVHDAGALHGGCRSIGDCLKEFGSDHYPVCVHVTV